MKNAYQKVLSGLYVDGAKTATIYLSPSFTVKATRRLYKGRPSRYKFEAIVTAGKPNYRERLFIKDCKKAGVRFPIKKVQLRFYKKSK